MELLMRSSVRSWVGIIVVAEKRRCRVSRSVGWKEDARDRAVHFLRACLITTTTSRGHRDVRPRRLVSLRFFVARFGVRPTPIKWDSDWGFPCRWPCASCWPCASFCWPSTSSNSTGFSTNTTDTITDENRTSPTRRRRHRLRQRRSVTANSNGPPRT